MSKITAHLQKPKLPKENFHSLETTKPLAELPTGKGWDIVRECIKSDDLDCKVLGVYLNAILTENKLCHLLSGKALNNLLASQDMIKRKSLTNAHASSLLAKFEQLGFIKILRPVVVGKAAAVVRILDEIIVESVNSSIGQEISAQYELSVLKFYDNGDFHGKVPHPVPLESSTTTTNTTTNTPTNTFCVHEISSFNSQSKTESEIPANPIQAISSFRTLGKKPLNTVQEKPPVPLPPERHGHLIQGEDSSLS